MIFAAILALATAAAPANSPVGICMRAAAVVAHSTVKESDRDGCVCADRQFHKLLSAGDYALHEDMLALIASGAGQASFNKQMSDIMLKRGMNQADANQFLARVHAAEFKVQNMCTTLPLEPGPPPSN
jgi:hypothetical protein